MGGYPPLAYALKWGPCNGLVRTLQPMTKTTRNDPFSIADSRPSTSAMALRLHCVIFQCDIFEAFYDWKESNKGFHGCMTFHAPSAAEGLQTLPFERCVPSISSWQFVLSFVLEIEIGYYAAGWKKLLEAAEYGSIKKHLISCWAELVSRNCCWQIWC